MITIGLNADHDAGVALAVDGRIAAALSRERVNRVKAALGLPLETIPHALAAAGLEPGQVDAVCLVGGSHPGQLYKCARQYFRPLHMTRYRGMFGLSSLRGGKAEFHGGLPAFLLNAALATGLPKWYLCYHRLERAARRLFPRARLHRVSHHEGHAVGAYCSSGFERCLNVVIEGCDFDNCLVIERYAPDRRELLAATPWPHSPGYFYILVTQLLGFNGYTHGGKITGLAAFGDPQRCLEPVSRLMWTEGMRVRLHPDVHYWRTRNAAARARGGSWLPPALAPYSREEIAAAFQRRFEECLVEAVALAVKMTGERNLVLSGGCVANVRLNQLLHEIPGVERVFVMPPMGDVGVPVGLALEGARREGVELAPRRLDDVFWGPAYTNGEIEAELRAAGLDHRRCDPIEEEVARLVAAGKVVARFAGRMEFGPRALGNRSILYHCQDPAVNRWLNKRLRRTEFMPFAPAVLAGEAHRCFRGLAGRDYTAEFMTITCAVTDFMRERCPAAVHVDGTARPQLVTPAGNPSFHRILEAYHRRTGIPAIINTSFNMHEEPIVMTPGDAIRAFRRGHLDHLAIGDFLVDRQGGDDADEA